MARRPMLTHAQHQMLETGRDHLHELHHIVTHIFNRIRGRKTPAAAAPARDAGTRDAAVRTIAHHVRMAHAAAERGEHHVAAHHMRTAGDTASAHGFHTAAKQARSHADTHHANAQKAAQNVQQGEKGGSFVVTASGRKRYVSPGGRQRARRR